MIENANLGREGAVRGSGGSGMPHILPALVGDEAAVAGVGPWRDPIGASGEEDGAAIVGGGIQLHHRSMDPLATVKNPKYLVIGGRKSRGLQKKGLTL